MTEEQWLNVRGCAQWMMPVLRTGKMPRTKAGRRKLRLFACGCCRLIWDHLPDDRLRAAVDVAERFAEAQATKDELAAARDSVAWMTSDSVQAKGTPAKVRVAIDMAVVTTHSQALEAASRMLSTTRPLAGYPGSEKVREAIICDLLRCVFGNPFRPVTCDRVWLTATVRAIAQGIYDDRAFDRMPILADALDDAGCHNPALLQHLRSAEAHVRGCWALDCVLGKT